MSGRQLGMEVASVVNIDGYLFSLRESGFDCINPRYYGLSVYCIFRFHADVLTSFRGVSAKQVVAASPRIRLESWALTFWRPIVALVNIMKKMDGIREKDRIGAVIDRFCLLAAL